MISLLICVFLQKLISQVSATDKSILEPIRIVDMPTAGVIESGNYSVYGLAFPGGGLMTELSFGIFNNFNAGLSYGGINIVGSGKMSFQNYPAIHLKYRLINEISYFPAVVLGVDLQGREKYYNEFRRFRTMSPGIFFVMSKAFRWQYGLFSVHAGSNYSFEPPENQRKVNFYAGLEHSIFGIGSINFEYNNNSDDLNKTIMESNGLLNLGLKFILIRGLTLDFQLRDILENYTNSKGISRSLGLTFINRF